MKLLILIGNAAVGKMTVGQELVKITDLRLFHNHMMLEPVLEIFGYNYAVVSKLRAVVFEEFAKSDLYGMIFTFMWDFNHQSGWDYINNVCDIFKQQNAEIYFVELVAPQEVRLQRNVMESRLQNKPSKRNTEISNKRLISADKEGRYVSNEGEISFENYIRIDNSELSADVVAKMIKERFAL